jgi:hypothetical protein
MSGSWAPLLPVAMVGCDRQASALPVWPGEIGQLVAQVAGNSDSAVGDLRARWGAGLDVDRALARWCIERRPAWLVGRSCPRVRTNDWVPEVRRAAYAAVEEFLDEEHIGAWGRALGQVAALRRMARADHTRLLHRIEDFLSTPAHLSALKIAQQDMPRSAARLLLPWNSARLVTKRRGRKCCDARCCPATSLSRPRRTRRTRRLNCLLLGWRWRTRPVRTPPNQEQRTGRSREHPALRAHVE